MTAKMMTAGALIFALAGCSVAHKRERAEYADRLIATYRANQQQAKNCYMQDGQPKSEGEVVISWTVNPRGRILESSIKDSSVGDPTISECLLQHLQQVTFPASTTNFGKTTVEYTYRFSSLENVKNP